MARMRLCTSLIIVALATSGPASRLHADEKKDVFKITAVSPLALTSGSITTVHIMGLKMDQATAIFVGPTAAIATTQPTTLPTTQATTLPTTLPTTQATALPTTQPTTAPALSPDVLAARIVSKGKVEVLKGTITEEAGDTVADIEVVIPKNWPEGELDFRIDGPADRHALFHVAVLGSGALTDEKEPNNGFRDAQDLRPGPCVRGAIQSLGDVDVFRIAGKKGQTMVAEVSARRRHSLIDSLLTLYDEHRNIVAENDDANDADSLIRYQFPADGTWFLALTDANDHGGVAYPYLLSLKLEGN